MGNGVLIRDRLLPISLFRLNLRRSPAPQGHFLQEQRGHYSYYYDNHGDAEDTSEMAADREDRRVSNSGSNSPTP